MAAEDQPNNQPLSTVPYSVMKLAPDTNALATALVQKSVLDIVYLVELYPYIDNSAS